MAQDISKGVVDEEGYHFKISNTLITGYEIVTSDVMLNM